MEILNLLTVALRGVQDVTIGFFKPKFGDTWENVVQNREGYLTCITIGTHLGLSTLYIDKSQGRLVLFPDGKSLTDMMQDPTAYSEWYEEEVTNYGRNTPLTEELKPYCSTCGPHACVCGLQDYTA